MMLLGLSVYSYLHGIHGTSSFTLLSLFDMSTTTVGTCDHAIMGPTLPLELYMHSLVLLCWRIVA